MKEEQDDETSDRDTMSGAPQNRFADACAGDIIAAVSHIQTDPCDPSQDAMRDALSELLRRYEKSIDALKEALDTLEEDAIAQRAFWDKSDKHGIAAEAERIYEKAKAALSPNT